MHFFKAFSSFTCFISVFFRLSFDFILILFLHVHGCSHMSVNLLCLVTPINAVRD